MTKISAPAAWDITTGGANVVMAVFDFLVDFSHSDLAGNLWTNPFEIPGDGQDNEGNGYIDDIHGFDFARNIPGTPTLSHGTHVAGIMGAVGNNSVGVAGVNWNAQIMSIGILDGQAPGLSFEETVIRGFHYVLDMNNRGANVRISNHSWQLLGSPQPHMPVSTLYRLIQEYQQEDILVIAAAGNGGANNDINPWYPASFDLDNIISVANTTQNDELFLGSHIGLTSVDLGAPGAGILSTVPIQLDNDGNPDGYGLSSGTSMSAPHVAGVAGLAYNLPGMATASYQVIKGAIMNGVDVVSSLVGKTVTGGRLNALKTLNALLQPPAVVNGTAIGDTIVVRLHPTDSTQVQVLVNGSEALLRTKTLVPSLTVNGLDGNDTITMDENFHFPTTLNGGSGEDTISVIGNSQGAEVRVNSDAGNDTLNVNTDNTGVSRVRLDQSETLAALSIGTGGGVLVSADGSRVLRTAALSVASSGFIDLADNEMIVDYTTPSPLATIQSLVTSGYNSGAWNGNGIRSVIAHGAGNTAIGYAEASEIFTSFPATFAGQTVDNTTVVLRYTYYGDADLSGGVGLVGDFNRLASNFGQSPRRWVHGNFDFDSDVDLQDFNRLALNFGQSGLGPGNEGDDTGGLKVEDLLEILQGG